MNDILACLGVLLIALGLYFIYWPITLLFVGTVLTSYALVATYQEGNQDDEDTSTIV